MMGDPLRIMPQGTYLLIGGICQMAQAAGMMEHSNIDCAAGNRLKPVGVRLGDRR